MSYNPIKGNVISTANSTTALLTGSATWTGVWEEVVNYTTIAVAILGDNATDGTLYIESSQDGGVTVNSVPLAIPDASFDLPHIWNVVETHIRIKYVNGTTAQTGHFQLQTKYSNGQELGLLQNAGDNISATTDVQIVKSVTTGDDPNGQYVNLPASGVDNNNSTTTPLGIGGVWTGVWSRVDLYAEMKMSMNADVESADCRLELSHDGITVDTSLSVPPQLVAGQYRFIHSLNPSLPYFRVKYTNGAVAQTSFKFTTTLLTSTGNMFVSRATQVVDRYSDVRLQRIINSPEQDRNFGLVNYQEAKRNFGTNEAVGNSAFEDLWSGGTPYPFPQTAQTVRVKAGGLAADDAAGAGARTITVEGLDGNWNEISEDITLAGTSASAATSLSFIRINKAYTKTVGTYGGLNTGAITIENTGDTNELAIIPAGIGNTRQTIYTVPAGKTMWITEITVSVGLGNSADVRLFHVDFADDFSAPFNSAKHYEWGLQDFSGASIFTKNTFLRFDEKNDLIADAKRITGSGSATVSFEFDFVLTTNA